MFGFLKRLFAGAPSPAPARPPAPPAGARAATRSIADLVRLTGIDEAALRGIPIHYNEFQIPKRTGGARRIVAPSPGLKALQRVVLRRVLRRLHTHPCVTGFERGHSIVTNARPHVGRAVVIKLDLSDFFGSTSAARVEGYFRSIGWDDDAAGVLTRLCTHRGALPQGAPTSPRLSNLVNVKLDERLAEVAAVYGMSYSRYADDLTFSGDAVSPGPSANPSHAYSGNPPHAHTTGVIDVVKRIVREEGYTLHTDKKLRIARRHHRQLVTGLVVNEKVQLPRATRRRLRAIKHRFATTGQASLTPQQIAGWDALQHMISAPE